MRDKRYQQRRLKSLSMVEACRENRCLRLDMADQTKHSSVFAATSKRRCARSSYNTSASFLQRQPLWPAESHMLREADLRPVRNRRRGELCFADQQCGRWLAMTGKVINKKSELTGIVKVISKTAAGLRVKSMFGNLRPLYLESALLAKQDGGGARRQRESWKSRENVGYPAQQDRSRVEVTSMSRGLTVVRLLGFGRPPFAISSSVS